MAWVYLPFPLDYTEVVSIGNHEGQAAAPLWLPWWLLYGIWKRSAYLNIYDIVIKPNVQRKQTFCISCFAIIYWSSFMLRPSSSMNGIFCPSVRPSVRLSHLFDYVPIIVSSWNFQELSPRTRVRSMQKVKVRGQRSRSQRSRPNLTVSGL